MVKVGYLLELIPLRVVQTLVICVSGRGTRVAGVRTIMLKAGHTGFLDKRLDLAEIFVAPITAQTRRTAKDGTTAFARFGIDNIYLVADPTTGQ